MTSPATAADRRAPAETRREGVVARMVRLWLEHHQRVIDLGLAPH